MILARLLTPEDFGVVAAAMIFTAFCEVVSRIGTEPYLIQKTSLSDDDINTAWTIQLLAKLLVATLVIITAVILNQIGYDERVSSVLFALALIPVFDGLKSIKLVLLKKNIDFKPITAIEISSKLVSLILTVLLAFELKNYWAFIIGNIAYFFTYTVMSYLIASRLPRLSLTKLNEQLSFSSWTLFKGMLNFANGKMNQLFISFNLGNVNLGYLNVANRLLELPQNLLISPLTDSLFPALAKVKNDEELFKQSILRLVFFLSLFCSILSALVFLSRYEIVELFLGDIDKWYMVPQILAITCPIIVLSSLNGCLIGTLVVKEDVKYLFYCEIVLFFVILTALSGMVFFYEKADLLNYVSIQIGVSVCNLLLITTRIATITQASISRIASNILVPIVCIICALTLSMFAVSYIEIQNLFLVIIVKSTMFLPTALIFVFVITQITKLCLLDFQYLQTNSIIMAKRIIKRRTKK